MEIVDTLAFIDGMDFNTFFRGLLSTIAMFIVLCGGTYMILATNVGIRQGMLLALSGLFGWMFLMGIVWTIYGTGWVGDAPTWDLVEINEGELANADIELAQGLNGIDLSAGVESDDPDEAQNEAAEYAEGTELEGWRYLKTSDSVRGEAQSSVDEYLIEEEVYEAGDYVSLQFGAFATGGKPILEDDSRFGRVKHFFSETFLHPTHSQELLAVQVQGAKEQFVLAGESPPVPEIDQTKPVTTVVMERNRGGPIPSVISGLRFIPLRFTVITGALFLICVLVLHNRDKREALAVASK